MVVKLTMPTVLELVLLCRPSRCFKAAGLVVKVVKVEEQEVRLK